MSLDKKSIHIKVSPEFHARLAAMAEFNDKDIAELGAKMLEREIVAAWHDFNVLVNRANRVGLVATDGE